MSFFTGTPGRWEQRSTLGPEQQSLYQQALQAGNGAFGQVGNYYRDLLSNDSNDFNAFAAPEMRRFREQTIPELSEQFAGMGAGGLSSSGFRNAAVGAGTDLSERLGAIRAQLRQHGAQGLQNLASQGLQQFNENIYRPATPGFLEQAAPIVGSAIGAFGGPVLGAAGSVVGEKFGNWLSGNKPKDTTSLSSTQAAGPYGEGQTYNPYSGKMR